MSGTVSADGTAGEAGRPLTAQSAVTRPAKAARSNERAGPERAAAAGQRLFVADAGGTAKRAGREAESAGREAASSRWMRGLARAGLLARGVNYLLIGSLAVEIAFGSGGQQADTTGALRAVARHPGGIVVLRLLAAGFAGLALWRFAETAYGQAGPGSQTAPKRVASLALECSTAASAASWSISSSASAAAHPATPNRRALPPGFSRIAAARCLSR